MRPLVDGLPPAQSVEEYDDQPNYVLALCYPAGVGDDDAELTVISGSHLHRDPAGCAGTEAELRDGWARDRRHPISGEAMSECFHTVTLPPGSIVCLLSHCAHGVRPKPKSAESADGGSAVRWCANYCFRKSTPAMPPPSESIAAGGIPPRWLRRAFEDDAPEELARILVGEEHERDRARAEATIQAITTTLLTGQQNVATGGDHAKLAKAREAKSGA